MIAGIQLFAVRLVLVALGAAIGGVGRYLVVARLPWNGGFPWATWTVNMSGSLALGIASGLLVRFVPSCGTTFETLRCFLIVGLCGGFTTFSTFSNEMFRMLENAQWALAALYATSSLAVGVLAVLVGYYLAR